MVSIREFAHTSLVDDGRGLCGMETAETYAENYTPEFAAKEARIKEARIVASLALLGAEREACHKGRYPSERPVLFNTASMRGMCAYLSERHGQPWSVVLAESDGWTEIALYFTYLETVGRLEEVHRIGGPDAVLSLHGSVWHTSDLYREPRLYDRAHFHRLRESSEGLFVAIQSWLATDGWLPGTGFGTLEEFYAHLGSVLDVERL